MPSSKVATSMAANRRTLAALAVNIEHIVPATCGARFIV
jgi:hypothetical protein